MGQRTATWFMISTNKTDWIDCMQAVPSEKEFNSVIWTINIINQSRVHFGRNVNLHPHNIGYTGKASTINPDTTGCISECADSDLARGRESRAILPFTIVLFSDLSQTKILSSQYPWYQFKLLYQIGENFFSLLALQWRRQWHPSPVLLPGKSHGWRGLVGCSPWDC